MLTGNRPERSSFYRCIHDAGTEWPAKADAYSRRMPVTSASGHGCAGALPMTRAIASSDQGRFDKSLKHPFCLTVIFHRYSIDDCCPRKSLNPIMGWGFAPTLS